MPRRQHLPVHSSQCLRRPGGVPWSCEGPSRHHCTGMCRGTHRGASQHTSNAVPCVWTTTMQTSLTLSIPADALGITDTPSRLYWTNPSSVSLTMTSNPTVACGKLQWSYYIIPKSDTVTCGAAGIARPEAVTAKPVSRSPPDASDGRPGAAATVAATIGKCSPGACGFTTDLLQGKDRPYLLAVRLASDVQSTTQVAVVCLASEFYVDSTPPLLPQTANFARHVNPDPAYPDGIPRSNVLHHTQKIALEWDEFTDPESPWFGGADTNLMYR